jgi:type II secretory ATPase GspE/PulE/Tfp pilus assembly ATPase PilB-like protein
MYPELATIKAILLKESYVSEADNAAAEKVAGGSSEAYIEYLIRQELLSKSLLGQSIAEAYQLAYVDLERTPPSQSEIKNIPEDLARANRVIYIKENTTTVGLVSDRPDKVDIKALVAVFPGKDIDLAYTLPEYITKALTLYQQALETRFTRIIEQGSRVAPEIVDEIIRDALTFRVSDIHLEPQADKVIIRFRIDGALREAGVLPKQYYENILNRIKVESGMRIDEHFLAQDGSIRYENDEVQADLRVSLVPTVAGEKIVMRVLGSYVKGYNLADLGLSETHRVQFETAAAKPFGMILTTGPTGSGKTTSLYALIKILNRPDINITTIEDPVEYQLSGINQIQVRRESNLDFSHGLRAIVRQDPDVILVGEIRDHETAEISVNAALTGHLLLSTFHANDASTAIPRLIDMGIEPFSLASTLEIIIAQRLVRRLCTQCQAGIPAETAVAALPRHKTAVAKYFRKKDTVYTSKGCTVCAGSGYQGRIALFEIITVTPELEELITKRPSALEIEKLARKQGNAAMFADGIEKVKSGMTTLEEVLRVVEPPEVA